MMKHKNYIGKVKFDDEAEIFHGEIINTRDVITFQGTTVEEVKQSFIDSVEDYLSFCKERGEEPDKPFSGRFNLRLDPELHQQIYILAHAHNMSLNAWLAQAIAKIAQQKTY